MEVGGSGEEEVEKRVCMGEWPGDAGPAEGTREVRGLAAADPGAKGSTRPELVRTTELLRTILGSKKPSTREA